MRQRLVLLPLDELDTVVDQVGGEILDLLFGELDLLDPVDDLVVGEESLLETVPNEPVQLLEIDTTIPPPPHGEIALRALLRTLRNRQPEVRGPHHRNSSSSSSGP